MAALNYIVQLFLWLYFVKTKQKTTFYFILLNDVMIANVKQCIKYSLFCVCSIQILHTDYKLLISEFLQ